VWTCDFGNRPGRWANLHGRVSANSYYCRDYRLGWKASLLCRRELTANKTVCSWVELRGKMQEITAGVSPEWKLCLTRNRWIESNIQTNTVCAVRRPFFWTITSAHRPVWASKLLAWHFRVAKASDCKSFISVGFYTFQLASETLAFGARRQFRVYDQQGRTHGSISMIHMTPRE
jgi:hypothetical protein